MESKFEFSGIRFEGACAFADVDVFIEHTQSISVGDLHISLSIPLHDPSQRIGDLREQALAAARKLLSVPAAEDLLRSEIAKDPKADKLGIAPRR
ncbi:hypothetical protein GN316_06550 [Xylophilus sp. Kf1]|nr:hypothetical protein [Xylophilus sp. Kf1]